MRKSKVIILVSIFFTFFLLTSNIILMQDQFQINFEENNSEFEFDKFNLGADSPQDGIAKPPVVNTKSRGSRYLKNEMDLDDSAVQLTIYSGDANDNAYSVSGASPIATGDINNDGFDDLLIGSPYADGKAEDLSAAGQVMVFYGKNQTNSGTVYDQAKDPENIDLIIHGGRAGNAMGFAIDCGDIDGDGFDDMVISAPYGDGRGAGRTNAGEVYVIYGAPKAQLGSEINLQTNTPNLIIYGAISFDWLGFSVAVGNVNGDGYDDIIMGAYYADPLGRTNAGCVYTVFGGTRVSLGSEIDLLTDADMVISGAQPNDYAGTSVAVGDLNDDTFAEIIVGAIGHDAHGTRLISGATYIVYGSLTLTSTIDLDNSSDFNSVIYGASAYDYSGFSLATGNFNGDEYNDLAVGAPWGDGPGTNLWNSGEVYLIYGKTSLPAVIDANTNGQNVIIYGENSYDTFGYSIAFGNVNNDAYDDILIGAQDGDGAQDQKNECGDIYLILGDSPINIGFNIDLTTDCESIFHGIDDDDSSGLFVQMGDLDGDSKADIIIGSASADGPDGGRDSAGEFYVIYSAPPHVRNEFLMLLNGDINNKTILSQYKEYIFRINATNPLGYRDFDFVNLSLDPDGENVTFSWSKVSNDFSTLHNPKALVECLSTAADATHDKNFNYTIDFRVKFNWNFTSIGLLNCKVTTNGIISQVSDDIFTEVFQINNQLRFIGNLKIEGALQGKLKKNDWIKGGEELTFSGLTVVYNSTTDYFPPVSEYSIGIDNGSKITKVKDIMAGEKINAKISAPTDTEDYDYSIKILDQADVPFYSTDEFSIRVDSTAPAAPELIVCKADSIDDIEVAKVDDDTTFFVIWDSVLDVGSGTTVYYFNLSDNGGTNNGVWTDQLQVKIDDGKEGLNNIYIWTEDAVGNIGLANYSSIFIDLTEVVFENFTPDIQDNWFTSNEILCTVEVNDLNGYGVDGNSIFYWNDDLNDWFPTVIVSESVDKTSIKVSAKTTFKESENTIIRFRATDLAGNGPTKSEIFTFKIDSKPVTFTAIKPNSTRKQKDTDVRCYVTVEDLGGSGIDATTIQYSFSTAGLDNFGKWGDSNLAIIANQTNSEQSIQCFVDLPFSRGSENFIRWRAKDIAGNGYTVSENLSIVVNSLPIIIVDEPDKKSEFDTKSTINLNGHKTYDIDDELDLLTFTWTSNISGNIGSEKNLSTKLSAGHHRITLTVFDGFNNATQSINIKIRSAPSDSGDGSDVLGTFNISEDGNSLFLIILFIVIIIIIILFFSLAFSKEKRKRKKLEEKVMGAEVSYLPPQTLGKTSTAGPPLAGTGTVSVLDATPITDSAQPMPTTQQIQQLPTITQTTAASTGINTGTGTGSVTSAGTTGVPRELPQLPPAPAEAITDEAGISFQEDDIDPEKKLELLDKKMLTGEITVELYDKLAKRYEERIKQKDSSQSQPPSTIQSTPSTLGTTESTGSDASITPTVAMPSKSEQPTIGLTPDSQELQKKKEKK